MQIPRKWNCSKNCQINNFKSYSLRSYFFFISFLFFFQLFFISWRLITLQYCSGFCHTLTWISHGLHEFPILILLLPPSLSHHPGSSQWTIPEHLYHASNLGWWSLSPLIVYLFQCYSLRTKIWNASRICVSSLHRGHDNLLGIVPILVYVLPKWALCIQILNLIVCHVCFKKTLLYSIYRRIVVV